MPKTKPEPKPSDAEQAREMQREMAEEMGWKDVAQPITVEIGRVDVVYGTVRVDADGSVTYHGRNADAEQILHNVVANMGRPDWDEETTIRSLPRRLTNYLWAREVPDHASDTADDVDAHAAP